MTESRVRINVSKRWEIFEQVFEKCVKISDFVGHIQ